MEKEELISKRYPEFNELIAKIVNAVAEKINAEAPKIKSQDMPYKCQYVLEEVIKDLQSRV